MQRRFSFFVKRFLSWAVQVLSPTTVAVYRHYFNGFMRHHGDLPLRRLKPCTLTAWAKTWHQSQAIKRLFTWCHLDAGLVKANPFTRCKNPPKGARHRIFTPAELRKIFRGLKPDFRALLTLHRETFARPREIREARWEDLRPAGGRRQVCRALLAGLGVLVLRDYKARVRRRLPNVPRIILLSPAAGRVIAAQMKSRRRLTGPILLTAAGRAWTANAVRCRFRRLRAAAGLGRDDRGENVVPYTFRHSGGTLLTAAGLRDRTIADILGHTETATTARYQHLQTSHLRTALRRVWRRRPAARRR